MDEQKARAAAEAVAAATGADVLAINGDMRYFGGVRVIEAISTRKKRKRVIVVLVTPGGDADTAFRIGRALQNSYEHVSFVIAGWCKSAGTLLAIAGHELIITDGGELGPLDVQLAKADEMLEYGSGLTPDAALKTLETTASRMFQNLMQSIRLGMMTTRTASDLSVRIIVGLLAPIYQQIDPQKIGETSRAMQISRTYGSRLDITSKNLRPQGLEWLVSLYPDHGFVIDRREAQRLFTNVKEPTQEISDLVKAMGSTAVLPIAKPPQDGLAFLGYLSSEPTTTPRRAKNASASTVASRRGGKGSAKAKGTAKRKRAGGAATPP